MLFPNALSGSFWFVLLSIVAYISALCVAISFHEFAHAFVAKCEGDYTAKVLGRCTLAPHSHFDLKGFIFLLLFRFGWAKPVPVDSRNFKRGKRSSFWVSCAGILTNLILGTLFLFVFMLLVKVFPQIYDIPVYGYLLGEFLTASVSLNFTLAFVNLLPIYPLDGHRIIESCSKHENNFLRVTKEYSLIFLLLFSLTGIHYLYYTYTSDLLITGLVKLFSLILGL